MAPFWSIGLSQYDFDPVSIPSRPRLLRLWVHSSIYWVLRVLSYLDSPEFYVQPTRNLTGRRACRHLTHTERKCAFLATYTTTDDPYLLFRNRTRSPFRVKRPRERLVRLNWVTIAVSARQHITEKLVNSCHTRRKPWLVGYSSSACRLACHPTVSLRLRTFDECLVSCYPVDGCLRSTIEHKYSPCRGSFDEKDHVIKAVIAANDTALPAVVQHYEYHMAIYTPSCWEKQKLRAG